MSGPAIDTAVFAELQETAGADFVQELVDTFLEEAPGMLGALRGAAAASQGDAYRRAAHSLKSNANTFGASALAAMARDLELGGLPPAGTDGALAAVEAEYARVAGRLRELRGG